jgi:TetR/AcrR family transcriptional regulator, cholesterol catabolism regulator
VKLTHIDQRFPKHPTDVRTQILMEASALFQRLGYSETPMTAIASAVNITPAALYWHFKSKEDILYEFVNTAYEGFDLEVEAAIAEATGPADQLGRLAYVTTYIRLVAFETAGMETSISIGHLARSLSPEQVARLRSTARQQFERCRTIIVEGVRLGVFDVPDPVSAAFAISTMCESASLWFHGDGGLTVDEVAKAYEAYTLRIVGCSLSADDPALNPH